MRLGAQPFLWKWVLFAWEWKMVSISKAEHLPSFWNRGPGELGNGLLITPKERSLWGPRKQTSKASNFTKWKNEILRMTILPVFSQFLWNLIYIFSGSHKKLSLVLLQITNYMYSPWKVWKRMGCDDSVLIAEDYYRQISFASSKRG